MLIDNYDFKRGKCDKVILNQVKMLLSIMAKSDYDMFELGFSLKSVRRDEL